MSTNGCPSPEAVQVGEQPVLVGRSRAAELWLSDSSVSRRHATLTRNFGRVTVCDHGSAYGTFVNGVRIRSVAVEPGDRIRFGTNTVYRVEADGLRREPAPHGLALTARGLSLARGRRNRLLLAGIDFEIAPDAFVGILGPSGAGKSTLLNSLAGHLPAGEGTLVFDQDRPVADCWDEYRAVLGYVPQDDHLYGRLTARENLAWAARLRGGAAAAEVDRVLEQVGLFEHADKPTAVLSGGQRKRLSVAFELLKRPRLLLLDEPTSGLDPAAEAHLMEQFRRIADRGTTVVCTTHLMDNIRLFDALIVLGVAGGVGRLAYAGPPEELLGRFGCRGFADVYEKLASGAFAPLGGPSSSAPAAGPIQPAGGTPGASTTGARVPLQRLAAGGPEEAGLGQAWAVGQRAALLIGRDRGLWPMMVLQPLGLGLLSCLTQFRAGSLLPVLFFSVVIAIWLGLNNSARDLVRERRLYIRERLAGLRPAAYLAGKSAVHLLFGAGQILILLGVLRLTGDWALRETVAQDLSQLSWLRACLVLLLAYCGGLALGLLLSTLVNTEETAVAALPLLIMPQLLLSVVATGLAEESYTRARPFRPLHASLYGDPLETAPERLIEYSSLACLSRPAALALEAKPVGESAGAIWLLDLGHLLLLVLATAVPTYLAFHRAERRWTRLIGVH